MRFESMSRLPRIDGDVWRLRFSDPALTKPTVPTERIVPVDLHLAVRNEIVARTLADPSALGPGSEVRAAVWVAEGGGVGWCVAVFPRGEGDAPDLNGGRVSGPYPTYALAAAALDVARHVPANALALLVPMTPPSVGALP